MVRLWGDPIILHFHTLIPKKVAIGQPSPFSDATVDLKLWRHQNLRVHQKPKTSRWFGHGWGGWFGYLRPGKPEEGGKWAKLRWTVVVVLMQVLRKTVFLWWTLGMVLDHWGLWHSFGWFFMAVFPPTHGEFNLFMLSKGSKKCSQIDNDWSNVQFFEPLIVAQLRRLGETWYFQRFPQLTNWSTFFRGEWRVCYTSLELNRGANNNPGRNRMVLGICRWLATTQPPGHVLLTVYSESMPTLATPPKT